MFTQYILKIRERNRTDEYLAQKRNYNESKNVLHDSFFSQYQKLHKETNKGNQYIYESLLVIMKVWGSGQQVLYLGGFIYQNTIIGIFTLLLGLYIFWLHLFIAAQIAQLAKSI